MTGPDAQQERSGRGLDAEIAEKVMGWKHAHGHGRCFASAGFHRWQLPDETWRTEAEMPRYSTRIEAAWLVVERMREQGYSFEVKDQRRYGRDGLGVEFIALGSESRSDGWGVALSLPLAICLAALGTRDSEVVDGE